MIKKSLSTLIGFVAIALPILIVVMMYRWLNLMPKELIGLLMLCGVFVWLLFATYKVTVWLIDEVFNPLGEYIINHLKNKQNHILGRRKEN